MATVNGSEVGMTADQIEACKIPLDTWTSLEGICQRIHLHGDSYIGVSPDHFLFYFSSDSGKCPGCMLKKNLTGSYSICEEGDTVPEGYVKYKLGGKYVLNKVQNNGIELTDTDLGKIHQVVFYDNIVGFVETFIDSDVNRKRILNN
jgi:hypothetical protein